MHARQRARLAAERICAAWIESDGRVSAPSGPPWNAQLGLEFTAIEYALVESGTLETYKFLQLRTAAIVIAHSARVAILTNDARIFRPRIKSGHEIQSSKQTRAFNHVTRHTCACLEGDSCRFQLRDSTKRVRARDDERLRSFTRRADRGNPRAATWSKQAR